MYFNKFATLYKNQTGNVITRDELNNQISNIIEKVKQSLEVTKILKEITIKVIDDRMYYMKTGHQKHGITKMDYKSAIDVLCKIAEKDIKDEQQKMFVKFMAEYIKSYIGNT